MTKRAKTLGSYVAAIVLTSCGYGAAPVRFEMSQHFGRARAMYTSLLYGELDLAQESARLIAESDPSTGLPDGSGSLASAVRSAARRIAGASSLTEAAVATGPLAQRCVTCHERYGASPRLRMPDMPSAEGTLPAHMARYRWSVDRMWEGVMTGSAERWDAGIMGLQERPLDADALEARGGEEATAFIQRVDESARRGAVARAPSTQAAAFGRTLEACIACHEAVRKW